MSAQQAQICELQQAKPGCVKLHVCCFFASHAVTLSRTLVLKNHFCCIQEGKLAPAWRYHFPLDRYIPHAVAVRMVFPYRARRASPRGRVPKASPHAPSLPCPAVCSCPNASAAACPRKDFRRGDNNNDFVEDLASQSLLRALAPLRKLQRASTRRERFFEPRKEKSPTFQGL